MPGKFNYCKREVKHFCTADANWSKCKFNTPRDGDGCLFQEAIICGSKKAQKDAAEKQRAEEYTRKNLTA